MTTTILLQGLVTFGLYMGLSTALYYLGARAKVTRPLRRLYPDALADLMYCPACSTFWYGGILALVLGRPLGLPFLGLDGGAWYTPLAAGLVAMVIAPLHVAWLADALLYVDRIDSPPEVKPEVKVAPPPAASPAPPALGESYSVGLARQDHPALRFPMLVACDCPGVRGQHVRGRTYGCVHGNDFPIVEDDGPRAA